MQQGVCEGSACEHRAPLTMPVKRPAGPLSCSVCLSTRCTGSSLPHCSTVFAKSSGIVMLAAVAPAARTPSAPYALFLTVQPRRAHLAHLGLLKDAMPSTSPRHPQLHRTRDAVLLDGQVGGAVWALQVPKHLDQ